MDALSFDRLFGKDGVFVKKEKLSQCSFTVEAAFLMPFLLMIVFLFLLFIAYVHNRAWYTEMASEAIISASTEGAREKEYGEKILKEKMEKIAGKQIFPSSVKIKTKSSKKHMGTEVNLQMKGVFPEKILISEIDLEEDLLQPVVFIRNLMLFERIGQEEDQ